MALISPSILAGDFAHLAAQLDMLNRSEADWVHCDIMDGRFVPNISFGLPVLQAIRQHSQKPLDVHLMILEPEKYVSEFRKAGADILTVHYEACTHLDRTLHAIRAEGMQAGIAINPSTPVEVLRDVLYCTDLVCLMSVNPGFAGQSFIHNTYKKLARLDELIRETNSQAQIEIDGGVTSKNAAELLRLGAGVLVAGNFVFKAEDPIATIAQLKHTETEKLREV
jgi:ribulose-phosphate 3-epimerase